MFHGEGGNQPLGNLHAAEGDAQGIEQAAAVGIAGFLYGSHQLGGRLGTPALKSLYAPHVVSQVEEVGELVNQSLVDELGQRLFRDAVYVQPLLGDEAGELAELLGGAIGIGALQTLYQARFVFGYLGGGTTYGALGGYFQLAHFLPYLDDLWDNLVGLDNGKGGTLATYAETTALTDIAQRGTPHGGAFQLHGGEHRHW